MAEANNTFRNQWSETLKQATRHHFEMWGFGLVKYIGNKDDRYAYDKSSLPFCKCEVTIPESVQDKQVFLFTFKDYTPSKGPSGLELDETYDSIEDMIAAGWVID